MYGSCGNIGCVESPSSRSSADLDQLIVNPAYWPKSSKVDMKVCKGLVVSPSYNNISSVHNMIFFLDTKNPVFKGLARIRAANGLMASTKSNEGWGHPCLV